MQSTYIPKTASELISFELTHAKSRQPRLIAKWQKIDGKLVCKWIPVTNRDTLN